MPEMGRGMGGGTQIKGNAQNSTQEGIMRPGMIIFQELRSSRKTLHLRIKQKGEFQ